MAKTQPRILQLLVGEQHGGAERFFVKLSLALHRRGIPQLVVIGSDSPRAAELAEGGCDTVELDFHRGLGSILDRRRLQRIADAYKPDIALAWMNRAARRMPRGDFVKAARLGGYYKIRNYRKCDWLIGISPDLVRHVVDGGWPAERAVMIPNFGELRSVEPVTRAMFDTPADVPLLLALGRLHPDKAHDTLLAALAQLPGYYLWLAGAGPLEKQLKSQAADLGIMDRVRFLGWRDDQAALLQACDICVHPSRHEPLSNVIVETWCQGVPVVATASEGPSWYIEHEETGLLSPIDDVEGLAANIGRVIEGDTLRQCIAEKGHAKWRARFSEDAICDEYLDFFSRITNSGAQR